MCIGKQTETEHAAPQAKFLQAQKVIHEKRSLNKQEITKGWYNEKDIKEELNWTEFLGLILLT